MNLQLQYSNREFMGFRSLGVQGLGFSALGLRVFMRTDLNTARILSLQCVGMSFTAATASKERCYPKGPKDPIIRYLGLG